MAQRMSARLRTSFMRVRVPVAASAVIAQLVERPASEIGVAVTHHLAMVGSRIRVPYFGPCEIGVVEARHSSKVKASDRVRHLAPSAIRIVVNPPRLGRGSRKFESFISDRSMGGSLPLSTTQRSCPVSSLEERLFYMQGVGGSIPPRGTIPS